MSEDPSYRAFEAKVRQAIEELVADVRRQAQSEADNIRRAAASEAAGLLAETERRRNELQIEIQRLEAQLAQVSSGIQALLKGQLAGAALAAAPQRRLEVAARATEESERAAPPEPEQAEPPYEEASPSPPEPAPRRRPIEPARPGASAPVPATPAPTPSRPEPAATTPAPPPEDVSADAAPEDARRTEVAVSGTPSFARALELQRGIQRTPGVRHVQALQFERGTLVLAVEHDASVDLTEAVRALPNIQLEMTGQSADRLEFAFA
jgi:hypothetical protein